jgi:hypothetical protein
MIEVDVRMAPRSNDPNNQVKRWTDPFVDNIGDIVYNTNSGLFAVSGSTDFSVWKHEANQATLWSHSSTTRNVIINEMMVSTYATFFNPDTVITSSSSGQLGVYLQGSNGP